MPNDSDNAVQEALEQALSSDADSQTANKSDPEVAEAVKSALGSEESASESETDKSTDKSSKEQKTVPYDRFTQVVKQKNEFSERYKNLEEQLKTANDREKDLRSRVGDLEQDHQILEAIKNLAQDEKYRDHVVAIDKALQGIEDEVEKAKEVGDKKAESEILKQYERKAAELKNLIADQNADRLWDGSSDLAKQYLQALPEEYTDEDRTRIGKLWTPRVDWNRIESEGKEVIPEVLRSSFIEVIKEYGIPQGALVAKTRKEIESKFPQTKVVSEEDTVKSILGKEWSAKDDKGKTKLSDDEFTRDLAELIRRTSGV